MPFTGKSLIPLMPNAKTDPCVAADTIRILIATDSHVGFEERDPVRKDDSWRSFDEVMKLAKSEDVSEGTCLL